VVVSRDATFSGSLAAGFSVESGFSLASFFGVASADLSPDGFDSADVGGSPAGLASTDVVVVLGPARCVVAVVEFESSVGRLAVVAALFSQLVRQQTLKTKNELTSAKIRDMG
jgi:hypothetical protein